MLLACSGFLWSLFLAPAAQFLNEFLRTERGFSGALIAVFVLATNTPAGIGIVAGGKLADRHGRRLHRGRSASSAASASPSSPTWRGAGRSGSPR